MTIKESQQKQFELKTKSLTFLSIVREGKRFYLDNTQKWEDWKKC